MAKVYLWYREIREDIAFRGSVDRSVETAIMPKKSGIKEEIRKHGYKIMYVTHRVIKDYNACYNVEYKGKTIRPLAAGKLGIPLNEI